MAVFIKIPRRPTITSGGDSGEEQTVYTWNVYTCELEFLFYRWWTYNAVYTYEYRWERYNAVYGTLTGEYSPGDYIDIVTSPNRNAYPDDGCEDGVYYYKYLGGMAVSVERGASKGPVIDYSNSNAYPENGVVDFPNGTIYYVYEGPVYDTIQGAYSHQVTSTDPNAYPDNDASGEYWYVKITT